MPVAFQKFLTDLLTAGISAASVAVLALNLDVVDERTVALAAAIGFINGVINAARRALPA